MLFRGQRTKSVLLTCPLCATAAVVLKRDHRVWKETSQHHTTITPCIPPFRCTAVTCPVALLLIQSSWHRHLNSSVPSAPTPCPPSSAQQTVLVSLSNSSSPHPASASRALESSMQWKCISQGESSPKHQEQRAEWHRRHSAPCTSTPLRLQLLQPRLRAGGTLGF